MPGFNRSIGIGVLIGFAGAGAAVTRSQERAAKEWRYYGGDHAFTRYSPLAQITRDNVASLKVAWRRPAVSTTLTEAFPDLKVNAYLKSTPIVIDGVVYAQNAHGLVTAFDGASGKTIWEQEALKEEAEGESTRGLDSWHAGADYRLIAIRGEYLYALNAKTGKPYPDFGEHGRVTLHFAEPQPRAGKFTDTSGPIVLGNVVVVAGYTNGAGDGGGKKERARDDVRGFDVRSGKLLWTFHVVPQAGEPGTDRCGNDSWKYAGDLGAWNPLSADEDLAALHRRGQRRRDRDTAGGLGVGHQVQSVRQGHRRHGVGNRLAVGDDRCADDLPVQRQTVHRRAGGGERSSCRVRGAGASRYEVDDRSRPMTAIAIAPQLMI